MGSQESESLGSKRALLNSTSELSHSAPPVYHETSAIYHETSAIERPIESAVPRAPVESVSTAPTDVSYDQEAPLSSGKSRNESSDFNPPCHQNYEHVIAGLTALSMESTLKGNISNRIENEYNGNLSLKTTNRVIKQASVETPQLSTPEITLIGPGNIRMDVDRVEEDQSVLNGLKPLDRKIVSFFRKELLILYRAKAWENLEPVVSEYLAKLASLSRSANIEIERELIRWSIVLARAKGARGFYKDSADILKPWENTKGELRAVIQHLQAFNVLGFESDIQNAQTYCTQAYLSEEHSFGRASVATIELMVITLRRLGKMIEAEFYNSLLDPRNNIRYSSGTLGAVLQPYHLHLSYGVRSISINGKDGDIIKAWDDCVNYPDDNKLLLMLLNIGR